MWAKINVIWLKIKSFLREKPNKISQQVKPKPRGIKRGRVVLLSWKPERWFWTPNLPVQCEIKLWAVAGVWMKGFSRGPPSCWRAHYEHFSPLSLTFKPQRWSSNLNAALYFAVFHICSLISEKSGAERPGDQHDEKARYKQLACREMKKDTEPQRTGSS